MVADSTPTTETEHQPGEAPIHGPVRVRRLIRSIFHVVELQVRILLLRVKITVVRLAISIALLALAALLGLFGLICLSIALFQGLASLMPVAWAWLTYGSIHLIAAAIVVFIAQRILRGDDEKVDTEKSPPQSHALHRNIASSGSKESP